MAWNWPRAIPGGQWSGAARLRKLSRRNSKMTPRTRRARNEVIKQSLTSLMRPSPKKGSASAAACRITHHIARRQGRDQMKSPTQRRGGRGAPGTEEVGRDYSSPSTQVIRVQANKTPRGRPPTQACACCARDGAIKNRRRRFDPAKIRMSRRQKKEGVPR